MMTKTTTTWTKDEEFTSNHGHSTISLDGNKKNGFGPKALLLSALAACSGIDIVEILKKQRVEFSHFEIDAEADQTEEHPKVYKEFLLTYKIKTDKTNEEKVKKAIDLSLEKYCGVSAMLKKHAAIRYTVKLV